jgi:hypothetical protein
MFPLDDSGSSGPLWLDYWQPQNGKIDDVQDNLLEELEESILNLSFSPPAKKVKCYSEDDNAREDIIREEEKILQDCIPGVREEIFP